MNIPTVGETLLYSVVTHFVWCSPRLKIKTGLVVTKGDIFGGDGCARTDTLGTDAVSESTLGSGAGGGGCNNC